MDSSSLTSVFLLSASDDVFIFSLLSKDVFSFLSFNEDEYFSPLLSLSSSDDAFVFDVTLFADVSEALELEFLDD